jgi:hypothetical protein
MADGSDNGTERYEISISQTKMDRLSFSFVYHRQDFYWSFATQYVFNENKRNCLPSRVHAFTSVVLLGACFVDCGQVVDYHCLNLPFIKF